VEKYKIAGALGCTKTMLRIVWGLLGSYIILAALFRSQWLSNNIPETTVVVSIFITFIVVILIWMLRRPIAIRLERTTALVSTINIQYWVSGCLLIGVILRLGGVAIAPDFDSLFSDSAAYWDLAQKLAAGDPYDHARGRSFWPPGLPLLLAPLIAIFGATKWVVIFLNIIIYIATSYVAFFLAKRLAGYPTARMSILILAIWPNYVLYASIPAKETVIALLLPAAVHLYLLGTELASGKRNWRWLNFAGCGACLGFAALTQPATTLFGFIFIGYEMLSSAPLRQKVIRIMIAGIVTIFVISPWTIRNYAVHGEFVPINTAGGIVFYSANNANAGGGWIPLHDFVDAELQQADEIRKNRLAYERAFAWINENRLRFVELVVLKQTRFLCCDATLAFLLFNHPLAPIVAKPLLYKWFALVSNTFWLFLALLILYGAMKKMRLNSPKVPVMLLCMSGIVYFLIIFSLFESESKQHDMAIVFFALIASCAFQLEEPFIERCG